MPENASEEKFFGNQAATPIRKDGVPPSSSSLEIEIRTMASDLDMLGRSGGGVASPERVSFVGDSGDGERMESQGGAPVTAKVFGARTKSIVLILGGVAAGIAILFFLGFFLPSFFN